VRHRVTAVSRVAGNAGIGIGGALGGLVAASGLTGFVVLFLANAVTYVVYVAVLAAVVHESPRREPVRGGYRAVLRDRAFVHLAVADVAMIAIGWGVFSWLLPPFARNQLGLSTALIGLLLMANALTVVVAQVPVARFAEGRRRALTMALAGALFCGACLLVELPDFISGASRAAAYAILVTAVIAAGVGECLHTTALTPLVAELAPAHLRGRYMAVTGFCFWIGLAAAPTGGTALLSVSATLTFGVAAAVAAAAAVSMLRLERRLPEAARLTPRPRRSTPAGSAVAGGLVRAQHAGRRGDQDGQASRDEQRVAQAHAGGGRADGDRAAQQAAVGDRGDPADVPPGAGGVQPDRRGDDLREDPGQAGAEQREPGDGRRRGADQQPGGQAQSGDQAAGADQPD
jgi:hypothetical protein